MVNHTHAEPGNTFHESRTAQVGITRGVDVKFFVLYLSDSLFSPQ